MVKKVYESDGTTLKEKVIYVNENSVRVINDSGSFDYTYVYHNDQLVAQELDGERYFIHSEHLGSTSVVTDESGNVIENTTYSPYGEVVSGDQSTRYGYEAKEHDSVIGDTDFHFRKYKAEWGLFLQPDTLIPNLYDPQSLNRYMFERGNPLKYEDKDGHNPLIALAVVAAIFAAEAAIQEGVVQYTHTGRIYSWGRIGKSALVGAGRVLRSPVQRSFL